MPYKLSDDKRAVLEQQGEGWVERARYAGYRAKERARRLLTVLVRPVGGVKAEKVDEAEQDERSEG